MVIKQNRVKSLATHLAHIRQGEEYVVALPLPVEEGLLTQIGFQIPPETGTSVLPSPGFGKVSLSNAEGTYVIRRDLPMETAYTQVEWHWKEWRGNGETEEMSDIRERPYQRYPREFIPPQALELTIGENSSGKVIASPKFVLGQNDDLAIHAINLFLEIFGEAHILSANLESIVKSPVRRLNWTVLPQGNYPWETLKHHVRPILDAAAEGRRPIIQNRLETVSGYNPDFVAIGRGGFSGYLVFGFEQKGIYICESAFYGNATYIFEGDWEALSRLTKAEILDEHMHKERLVHRNNWPEMLRSLLH